MIMQQLLQPCRDCATVTHMDNNLLTTGEALAALGITSRSTLTRYVALGKISPAAKLPGATGAFLFDAAEVERLRTERDAA